MTLSDEGWIAPQEVAAMLAVSNKLRDHTRALLQAHIDSWETGYDVDEK